MGEAVALAERPAADAAGRERLVRDNIRLVYYVAHRYRDPAAALGIEFDDLVGAGMVGLWEAAMRFDPGIARFSTHAVAWIRGRLLRLMRDTARQRPPE